MQTSGSYGLVWIFHEKLGETTCLLLVEFSEVWGDIEVFLKLWAPSSSKFTNYMVSEATLSLLQRSSKKLPLDGRKIYENTMINMITLTLMQF